MPVSLGALNETAKEPKIRLAPEKQISVIETSVKKLYHLENSFYSYQGMKHNNRNAEILPFYSALSPL